MEDGDAARGLRAIVRGFVESGASMFLIDRDDFVEQVVEDLRGVGFDVHVALADVTDEAKMVRAFAEIGEVWANLYTQVNNARIITIKDLEPPASGIFSASCNSGGGPSPNLRAGLPSAADTTEPGTELLPGIDEATRHPAGRRGRRRSTDPEPSPLQHTTWTSAQDAKTSSTAPDRMSLSGAIPRPARCRDDEPLAASGCPTRAAPHPYGGAAVRRSSVSAYHGE